MEKKWLPSRSKRKGESSGREQSLSGGRRLWQYASGDKLRSYIFAIFLGLMARNNNTYQFIYRSPKSVQLCSDWPEAKIALLLLGSRC